MLNELKLWFVWNCFRITPQHDARKFHHHFEIELSFFFHSTELSAQKAISAYWTQEFNDTSFSCTTLGILHERCDGVRI